MNVKLLDFIGNKLHPIELILFVKWLLRIKRKIFILPDGRAYFIDPISHLGLQLQKNIIYESDMSNAISNILNNGDER